MTTSHYEELGAKVAVRKNVYKFEQKGEGGLHVSRGMQTTQ